MSLKNIDDLLVADMTNTVPVDTSSETIEDNTERLDLNDDKASSDNEEISPISSDNENDVNKNEVPVDGSKKEMTDTDDYGTEIPKQEKVYTQAEVDARINEAIRKRLKDRGETPQNPQNPKYQQQPQQQAVPEYDPNSADSWEVQLESFIDNTLTKREQQRQQQEWQRQEQETQTNFEIRFNQGMAKYNDFEQVIMGKPLTPQMVIATRGMSDPAAFIYAAAKTQAPELDRISKIGDPYAQAIELGRLEERMRKARNPVSQAPKPITAPKGDRADAIDPASRKWGIDDKLASVEKEMKKERMRGRNQ